MPMDMLSPFVFWAQDANYLYLKVDLKDIKKNTIKLNNEELDMEAYGIGGHGPSVYNVKLKFFNNIIASDTKKRQLRITPQGVQFTLKKAENKWWPRLLESARKPAWVKIDFDKWMNEDDEDDIMMENTYKNGDARDIVEDFPELYEKLNKDEFGYRKEIKKVYLAFYNLFQCVFFTYVLVVMTVRYAKEGPDSMEGTYDAVGPVLKFCQLLQYLEVMHPMFGYTKGSIMMPFLQITGRVWILFGMIDSEPRMQTKPVVFYLFFIWVLIEVIRYPYYLGELYKVNVGFLTWLRYSIWIPLYPLGILCEGIIILRNIPYFEETQKFSVSMPNRWNFTFHTPTFMKLHLLLLFFPGMYIMMSHMYRSRLKKIGPKKWKKNFE
uniref:Very-long-chain (3R)-3-hydroxyacyl-CoA dehydratase n=1 Tax=Clastoptera arizonana TaxID=38151 RepID=A0A1B6DZR9_9HEMI